MTRPLVVLDRVLDEIERDLAAHPPERGGALFGPAAGLLIAGFVHDRWASVTAASYHASLGEPDEQPGRGESLQAAVGLVEEVTPLRYRGTVHSHPGRLDRPSSQDLVAFLDSLQRNPWMDEFIGPIVTRDPAGPLGAHEVALPSGKISWFVAAPDPSNGTLELRRPTARVLPIGRELDRFTTIAGLETDDWQLSDVNGEPFLVATVHLPADEMAVRVWPVAHPVMPPLITLTRTGEPPRPVLVEWDPSVPPGDRLARAVERAVRRVRGGVAVGQPSPPPVPMGTASVFGHASAASPSPNAPTPLLAASAVAVRAGLRARLDGIVPDDVAGRRVLLAGAGSVGSLLAEGLVRSGVEHFVVVDPELVGAENLSRTVYVSADVGQPKVVALPRRLQAINPEVRVDVHPGDVAAVPRDVLGSIVAGCDLVVAATDDTRAQAMLDRVSYLAGVPAVFPGMYAGGRGGELVFTVPGLSSCYRCATAVRHSQEAVERPARDYGVKGRLAGEIALGSDIAHVTSAATKVALALLEMGRQDDSSTGSLTRDFLLPGMAQGHDRPATMVLFANVPAYSFFPKVFEGVPGQGAWQAVWLEVTGDPACPLCSEDAQAACR